MRIYTCKKCNKKTEDLSQVILCCEKFNKGDIVVAIRNPFTEIGNCSRDWIYQSTSIIEKDGRIVEYKYPYFVVSMSYCEGSLKRYYLASKYEGFTSIISIDGNENLKKIEFADAPEMVQLFSQKYKPNL